MAGGRPLPTSVSRRGIAPVGFDVTTAVRELAVDACSRLSELQHIVCEQIVFRICQTRRAGPYGVQATMTPLRFRDGAETTVRRHRTWRINPLPSTPTGVPALYLLSLYVPRFLDLPREEKLAVLVHELWHASPQFDGDLRRYGGGTRFHGRGCDHYHAEMQQLARRWTAAAAPDSFSWLNDDFAALRLKHGRIFGNRVATPRLFRV